MVLPVGQGDVDRRTGQRLRGLDAAEAGFDNDDIGARPGHGVDLFIARAVAKMPGC